MFILILGIVVALAGFVIYYSSSREEKLLGVAVGLVALLLLASRVPQLSWFR